MGARRFLRKYLTGAESASTCSCCALGDLRASLHCIKLCLLHTGPALESLLSRLSSYR